MKRNLRSVRWAAVATLAVAGLAAAANEAQARRGISTRLNSSNPACKTINNTAYFSAVKGYQNGSMTTLCEVYSAGSTAYAPCPANADRFDVAIIDPGTNFNNTTNWTSFTVGATLGTAFGNQANATYNIGAGDPRFNAACVGTISADGSGVL